MAKMTIQEAFDIISVHLLKQGRRSTNSEGDCQYRDEWGRKCAVGILIPGGSYRPEMEGRGVRTLMLEYLQLPFAHLPAAFLEKMQDVHDDICPADWEESLRVAGVFFNLNTDAMDEFLKTKEENNG